MEAEAAVERLGIVALAGQVATMVIQMGLLGLAGAVVEVEVVEEDTKMVAHIGGEVAEVE
jgi:hypothetical protein